MSSTIESKNGSLTIDGRTYSLNEAPSFDDVHVQKEVDNVLGQLSLSDVTDNLYMSVELIFVAYNGVAGAKGGSIQGDISDIQSRLALVCNECVETMMTFESDTNEIINQLVQTFKWLTRGHEAMAFKKLAHCKEASLRMSKSADGLATKFKSLQVDSSKARSSSIAAEASERDRKLAAEKAEKEIHAKQEAEKRNSEELVGQITEMQSLYDDAKQREETAQDKALILGITSALTSALGAGLGAYASARNPMAMMQQAPANGSAPDPRFAQAQQESEQKRKDSEAAQKAALEAKDEQAAKQKAVDAIQEEIDSLSKQIADMEQDADADEEKLKSLKSERDNKNEELDQAKTALKAASEKVTTTEKTAKDQTAVYAAAGAAFQNVAQSTGQMASSAATAEASIHEEKMRFLNNKLALEKEKRASLVALAEYAENVKNLKHEQGMANISVNSLHAAVEALGKIVGTLTNAALFWDQMANYCERMTTQGFQQEIADLTGDGGLSKEERLDYYYDPYFMRLFFDYMCQWVALNGLSEDYLESAQKSQQKAVQYLRTSPKIEDALAAAPELAKKMAKMVGNSLLQSRNVSVELEQQKAILEVKKTA